MIYTVTLNPSLDYVVGLNQLIPNGVNRANSEYIYPGGKGNNVAVILSRLGFKTKALGFKAGFTGNAMEEMLHAYGCATDFVKLKYGDTRINVKVNADTEFEINGQGPEISESQLIELMDKLDQLKDSDVLVLSGNISGNMSTDIYEHIMRRVQMKKLITCVDATGELLLKSLPYHPFLIKPNRDELADLFGCRAVSDAELIDQAKKLQAMGARNVLVSIGADGAILLTEQQTIERMHPSVGQVVNSVGAGDSMVAGFIAGYLNTADYSKALELGTAAGSATAFTSWLAHKADICQLLIRPAAEYQLHK